MNRKYDQDSLVHALGYAPAVLHACLRKPQSDAAAGMPILIQGPCMAYLLCTLGFRSSAC